MQVQMRKDVSEARKQLKKITKMAYGKNNEFVYNLAVKTYLKGYTDALKNVQKEADNE